MSSLRNKLNKNQNQFSSDLKQLTPDFAIESSKPEPQLPVGLESEQEQEPAAVPQPAERPLLAGQVKPVDPKKVAEANQYKFSEAAANSETPEDLAGIREMITQRFTDLDKQDREWMTRQYDKLEALNREAAKQYSENKERMQWGEIAQVIAENLAQIGLAYSAMKNGHQYSGPLEFKKTDWEARYNRALAEYKTQLSQNKDMVGEENRIEKTSSDKRRSESDKQIQLAIQTYQDQVRAARAATARIKKSIPDPKKQEEQTKKLLDAANKKYAAIESEIYKLDEGSQDSAKTIANINRMLGGKGSITELAESAEERGSGGFSIMGLEIFKSKPDKLKEYITRLKNDELAALGGGAAPKAPPPGGSDSENKTEVAAKNPPPPAPKAPEMVEIIGNDGKRRSIPKANLEKALAIPGTTLAK